MIEDTLDRTFFDLGSKLAYPFFEAHRLLRYRMFLPENSYDSCSTPGQEVAYRASIVAGAALTAGLTVMMPGPMLGGIMGLGIVSRVLRYMGCYFQKDGYTHVKGLAPEKEVGADLKVMTWNILGLPGGLHYDHGGVVDWPLRIDRIAQAILKANPDVLVLQEVFDTALQEALIQKLGGQYAHFYTQLGAKTFGVSGCMVLTKCRVENFSFTSFNNNGPHMNHGFATLDVGKVRVIGTHLVYGSNQQVRNEQFEQIKATLHDGVPTVIAGDLNTERPIAWNDDLEHGYLGDEPTCTNKLNSRWDGNTTPEENVDFVSAFKGSSIRLGECELVRAFDDSFDTKTAISDHHGVALTINGLPVV